MLRLSNLVRMHVKIKSPHLVMPNPNGPPSHMSFSIWMSISNANVFPENFTTAFFLALKLRDKLLPKQKSMHIPNCCSAQRRLLFMAGWPHILWLVIGSVQWARSLKTPPVQSGGPPLLIFCSRSLFDLPINGQNSGMSLGASWGHVMPDRHVTDGNHRTIEKRKTHRQ